MAPMLGVVMSLSFMASDIHLIQSEGLCAQTAASPAAPAPAAAAARLTLQQAIGVARLSQTHTPEPPYLMGATCLWWRPGV